MNYSHQVKYHGEIAQICALMALIGHKYITILEPMPEIKYKAKRCRSSYSLRHRHALALRNMYSEMTMVLNDATKIINYIKHTTSWKQTFQTNEDIGNHHQSLLLHIGVIWLSREISFARLMELRAEVAAFLMDHNSQLPSWSRQMKTGCAN